MTWALKAILSICCLTLAIPAIAWTYYLQQDFGVNGLMRYCKYNNGQIYTVNAVQICPISINDAAPGFGQGQGFLRGEYMDGMTKVCVYAVLGQQKALRIPSTSLCPLNANF